MAKIGIGFPIRGGLSRNESVEIVKLADELGYDSVWVDENWRWEAFTTLTHIACYTSRIKLGTSIVPVFSRSPSLLAMTAATLDEISGGRVILGLGISGPIVIENWHGEPFHKPIQRTREYIEIIRMALRGEKVDYQGESFHLKNFRLAVKPPRNAIPIYVGAMGPKNMKLTAELADGWMPSFLPFTKLKEAIDELEDAANAVGRSRNDLDVSMAVPMRIANTKEEVEAARRSERQHIGFYIGSMGTYFREHLSRRGYEREVQEVLEPWERGDRETALKRVPEELIDAMSIIGSVKECRRKIEEYFAAGVDSMRISIPGETKEAMAHYLREFAP